MHKKTKKRLYFWALIVFSISIGACIILYNLSDNITYFLTPTKLIENKTYKEIKLGGYVQTGTINKISLEEIEFELTDRFNKIKVLYKGPVPMIFRDDQGVVVTGSLRKDGVFVARLMLTKHDEKYKPKDILKR
ncbi:MAG: cytochrome c maturation protein CcmE [Rickettsiaceae bacterium]|nr:cytochrome c maturation protein CcmE [Rickettsiaceae bacterium]